LPRTPRAFVGREDAMTDTHDWPALMDLDTAGA
jgi:hypothetical protein